MSVLKTFICASLILAGEAALALTAGIQVNVGVAPCSQPRGSLQGYASGGIPPYTYNWSNGATTSLIQELPIGSYTLTVTDSEGTVATANADVLYSPTYPTMDPVVSMSYCPSGTPYAIFPRFHDGQDIWPVEPTTFSGFPVIGQFPAGDLWGIELTNMGAGVYQINYTDAVGCTGMFNWVVNDPVTFPTPTVSNIGGSCSNGSIGTATVEVPFVIGENDLHLTVRGAIGNVLYETECLGEQSGGWNGVIVPFTSLAPGDYWAVLDVDEYCLFAVLPGFLANCADSVMFTIPDLGIPCGEVIGTLYVDADGDCILDANENTVPNSVIAITPGPAYTSTGNNGYYSTEALPGPTTLTEQHPILDQSCPGAINVIAGTTQTLNMGMAPDAPLDAVVTLGGSPMRPGMAASYWIQARNLTDAITGTVTLTVQLDPVLNYIGANPAPTSVVGNTITWSDPDFTMTEVFEHDHFHVQVSLPPDPLLVGTVVSTTATLATQNVDADLSNNTIVSNTTVTASLDPNDKQARTSSQTDEGVYYLNGWDEWIDYTIRFQNTGTDTAFNVVITDSLPPTLDPATLLVGASSHPMSWTISGAGILRFAFPDILLPDSTTNEPASHGLVTFRIRPLLIDLLSPIINNADIFFDFNDPVRTNDAVLFLAFHEGIAEMRVGGITLMPNPATDRLLINSTSAMDAITIIAADGRVVMHRTVRALSTTLDVSALISGTYLLIASAADGSIRRAPFVVVHP